jgi:hypothetical protein
MTYGNISWEDSSHFSGINLVEPKLRNRGGANISLAFSSMVINDEPLKLGLRKFLS